MKITMVANDNAPTKAFEMVKGKLLESNVEVADYLNGSDCPPAKIAASDLVLIGMSCSPELAKTELRAAAEARTSGARYGFYADLYGCVNRDWFEPYRKNAGFVFVISPREAEAASALFPKAEVVVTGNPILEKSFFPKKPAAETKEFFGVRDGEIFLYCTAGKDLATNKAHFNGVAKAISSFSDWPRWKVFFMLHPRDKNEPKEYVEFVQKGNFRGKVVVPKELEANGFEALDAIAACDIMVGGGSTSEEEAARNRKPVITYLTPLSKERIKEQTGSYSWIPCELGISQLVMDNPGELANTLRSFFFDNAFKKQLLNQEANYPKPKERGEVVRKMVEALAKLAG